MQLVLVFERVDELSDADVMARPAHLSEPGYLRIFVGRGRHRLADRSGNVYVHRLAAEMALGRHLRRGEDVHHRDGDRLNNAPGNLEVLTRAEHRAEHRSPDSDRRLPGEANPVIACACGCAARFPRYDGEGRPRRYLVGHAVRVRVSRTTDLAAAA
ncbi:HNH endonuclease signature motif containing protein [Sorangium sp. So ce1667]